MRAATRVGRCLANNTLRRPRVHHVLPVTVTRRLQLQPPVAPVPLGSGSGSGSAPRAAWTAARSFSSPPPSPASSSSSAATPLRGMLTPDALTKKIKSGEIQTVILGFTDMYGRLQGKRVDADFWLAESQKSGTHACDYLLACDMEMDPIPGFDFANWERGFGDFHMVPDASSARITSWMDRSALVLCDVHHNKSHELLSVAPRSILRNQMDRLQKATGFHALAASELEYFMYEGSYKESHAKGFRAGELKPIGDWVEDYSLLQSAKTEKYNGVFRKHLRDSGVPVENSKGEAGLGQHELNVRYSDVLQMGDRHTVYKQCLKEVSDQLGVSLTFMAKPYHTSTGSGCHIHLSLHAPDGKNVFPGDEKLGPIQCSPVFKHFLAGWLKYTPDVMPFYAPNINSYKRFVSASWAPTRLAWSYDNRTAGFRVVGSGKSLRIECRIPGADCNIYLAFAASLASGLQGIEDKLQPPPLFEGDIYQAKSIPEVPKTLHAATDLLERSEFAKHAFGKDVVKHYAHFFRAEQTAFDRVVTDWERSRYFERI